MIYIFRVISAKGSYDVGPFHDLRTATKECNRAMGHNKVVEGPMEVGDDYILFDERKKKTVKVT